MERISEDTIQLDEDEQIIGDFYTFLRFERGMTDEQAKAFLRAVPEKLLLLTPEYLGFLTDGEPLATTGDEQES